MTDLLTRTRYIARKNVFALLHQWFRILDEEGHVLFYVKMRAFKLKEDLRVLGPDKTTPLFTVRARNIIDFGATYDVFDAAGGAKIGALRRKGLKSMFKDEWLILDSADREVGIIREDSGGLAFLRRFVGGIVNLFAPQQHFGMLGPQHVLAFRQTRNPFITKTYLDFGADTGALLDRRLGLAAAILLCAIDGKQ